MDEVEFAKFPDEFNVAKHLDLGDGTLLLLLRSKRVVMFVIDCGGRGRTSVRSKPRNHESGTTGDLLSTFLVRFSNSS